MAQLDLIPNPMIVAAQFGVFSAALVAVKKLYITPYLKLREQREGATTGKGLRVGELKKEHSLKLEKLERSLSVAREEIGKARDVMHSEALKSQEGSVKKARLESSQFFEKAQKDILSEASEAREHAKSRIPELVSALYQRLASGHA